MRLPLLVFAILAALGLVFDQGFNAYIQRTFDLVLVNIILAMSLNLVNGYTGQFSLGHAGFMAIGAYTSAFLSTQMPAPEPILLHLVYFGFYSFCGGLLAAAAGWLVGQPSLRLKGDYLAIVTLGFGEIIRVIILNNNALGGARGFFGIPSPSPISFGDFSLTPFYSFYLVAIAWVVCCYFVISRLIQSTHGRAFMSIREDEIAADSIGINTTQVKVRAFVLSSFFAGVGGSLFAHFSNFIAPSSFSMLMSINVVIMVVLGGMGSMTGPILAAILISVLPEALRPLQELTGQDYRMIIYSLILIVLMLVRPQGLLGHQEVWHLWRKSRGKLDS
jgi:branched-chain amino acid transport system permease protein